MELSDVATSSSLRDVPHPIGFSRSSLELEESGPSKQNQEIDANFKQAKTWETAQAPFRNLFMMGFMMWMAGNMVHLFNIGITFSALWQPVSALQGVNKGCMVPVPWQWSSLVVKFLFSNLNNDGYSNRQENVKL